MRILILDDNRAHGESLTDLLNSRGYEAYFAPTFEDASWLLDLFRFDVALLDYDMPGVTGLEAARELANRDRKLRILLMSARDANRGASESSEVVRFLPKPIRIKDLLAVVDALERGTSLTVRVSFPVQKYLRGK